MSFLRCKNIIGYCLKRNIETPCELDPKKCRNYQTLTESYAEDSKRLGEICAAKVTAKPKEKKHANH